MYVCMYMRLELTDLTSCVMQHVYTDEIRMNEVVFGVSSNDVLFALSSDETSVTPEGTNRLARMAGHVLEQQSFAPQLPVPSHTLSQVRYSKI